MRFAGKEKEKKNKIENNDEYIFVCYQKLV